MNQNKTTMMVVRAAPVVSMEERVRILTEWTDSRLGAREYGQRTGVPVHRLYWWRRMLAGTSPRARGAVPPLASLVEVPPPLGGLNVAEVMTRSGAVRFFAAAPPRWAAQLIGELNRC